MCTSGIYLCNDQDEELTLDMGDVIDIAEGIYFVCIPETAGSGQASDATGWNVAVAYCNGDDSPAVPPTGYTPPGPNGEPDGSCSGDDCEGITCDESSIVVQSQEVVTCNEYLGPTYTGAGSSKSPSCCVLDRSANVNFLLFLQSLRLTSARRQASPTLCLARWARRGQSAAPCPSTSALSPAPWALLASSHRTPRAPQ